MANSHLHLLLLPTAPSAVSGYKQGVSCFSSMQYHYIRNRCNLVITGLHIETIDLHVELEVTSVTHSILGPHSIQAPIIIFAVELSRPTKWAGNDGKSLLS